MTLAEFLHETYPWWAIAIALPLGLFIGWLISR